MRLGAALLSVALAAGCQPQGTPGTTVLAAASDDLRPDANPGATVTLRLGAGDPKKPGRGQIASIDFKADLVHKKQGSEVTLLLQTLGETIEREVYESTPEAFRILTATDDSFAPGIDLLHFPVREGASWEWSGKVTYAGSSRPATATIKLSQDGKMLLSDVQMKISVDPGRPELQRRLRFWFEKGKGVVRRAFGDVSARRPAGEEWQL